MRYLIIAVSLLVSLAPVTRADAPSAQPTSRPVLITLLHTNDLHGHVTHPDEPQGLARIATVADRVRAEMPHVLLLDAGDTIQSTPAMKLFGGKPIVHAMNPMRYDAATLGNHEFDFGPEVLTQAMSLATFPWVTANVTDTRTDKPWNDVHRYIIRDIDGVRVAISGLTTPQTVRIQWPRTLAGIRFDDPTETARALVPHLRETERADVIICLSHLGVKVDRVLAADVPGIDVILGGHSHTRLEEQEWVNGTLIMQGGPHARSVGRVDLLMKPNEDGDGYRATINGHEGQWWGRDGVPVPLAMNAALFPARPQIIMSTEFPEDPQVLKAFAPYGELERRHLDEHLTTLAEPMPADDILKRQTPLGGLVAEAIRWHTKADLAVASSTQIKPAGLPAGDVRVRDLYRLMGAYTRQHLVIARVPGRAIREMVAAAVTPETVMIQTAGFRVAPDGTITVGDGPLDDARTYLLAGPAHVIQDYLLGKSGVDILEDDPRVPAVRDAMIAYLRGRDPLPAAPKRPEPRTTTRPATRPIAVPAAMSR